MKARRTLHPRTVNVVGPIAAVAADPAFIVLAPAAVARLYCVSLAEAASPSSSWAARIAPRAAVGLLNVLLEDARFLLAVIICVREPSQNSAVGHASTANSCEGKRTRLARNLRRKCRRRGPARCGPDNSGCGLGNEPLFSHLLATARDHHPSGSGFGCRDHRRRVSG